MKKPDVLTAQQVLDQAHELQKQKEILTLTLDQIHYRLKVIESSLIENDQLKKQVKVQLDESLELFDLEWKRKSEFYPDLHIIILQNAVDQLTPK